MLEYAEALVIGAKKPFSVATFAFADAATNDSTTITALSITIYEMSSFCSLFLPSLLVPW